MPIFTQRRHRFRPVRTLLGGALFLVVVWLVGFVWYAGQITRATPGPDNPLDTTTADAVVVLTGTPDRLGVGFELLAGGRARRMFISGVYRGVDVQQILRALRRSPSEGDNAITLGYGADDTIGNARETAEWVAKEKLHSLILVTSNYHMPRALLEFHAEMPAIEIIPHATAAATFKIDDWWRWPGTIKLIASEWSKYLVARTTLVLNLRKHLMPVAGAPPDKALPGESGPARPVPETAPASPPASDAAPASPPSDSQAKPAENHP